MLKYDDRSNDNDSFSSLRYSVRGPNSLGMRSERNISIKYRSCHPSYLGKLDLNTCSASSPGLNGCISPFAKTDRLWFDRKKEPETQEYEIYKEKVKYNEEHPDGKLHINYTTESSDKYYDAKFHTRYMMDQFNVNIPDPDDHKLHVKFRKHIEWQEL